MYEDAKGSNGIIDEPKAIREEQVNIEDIARSLSLQCRFNGHTKHFYSVARHSINCVKIALHMYPEECDWNFLLALLLHDSAECYVGDIVRPLKYAMLDCFENGNTFGCEFQVASDCQDEEYNAFVEIFTRNCRKLMNLEHEIELTILRKYTWNTLTERQMELVKKIDTDACATESLYLCARSVPEGYPPLTSQYFCDLFTDETTWVEDYDAFKALFNICTVRNTIPNSDITVGIMEEILNI